MGRRAPNIWIGRLESLKLLNNLAYKILLFTFCRGFFFCCRCHHVNYSYWLLVTKVSTRTEFIFVKVILSNDVRTSPTMRFGNAHQVRES